MSATKIAGSLASAFMALTCIAVLAGVGRSARAACAPIAPRVAEKTADQPAPLSAEETMARRYPQPVRIGDLIGLPVYDDSDQTLGRIEQVVRTETGKICLIVPFGGWFGWSARPVAVPIEAVAILGRHVNTLEFTPNDFETAPTWTPGTDRPISANETIRIALGRR